MTTMRTNDLLPSKWYLAAWFVCLVGCSGADGFADSGTPFDAGAVLDAGFKAPDAGLLVAPTITSDLPAQYADSKAPRADSFTNSAHFTFTSPGATGFVCQLDGLGEFLPCTSGAALTFPGFFDHQLSVKAITADAESPATTVWWRSAFACTGDSSCPEVDLATQDPRSNPANLLVGFADPALKTFQGTSWLAYSSTGSQWPNGVGTAPEVLTIQAHLASSTNQGASWSFAGAQFGASGATEPVDLGGDAGLELGIASSEEIDLEAAMLGTPAKPYWFWIRQTYFNAAAGSKVSDLPAAGSMKAQTQHLRLGMLQASDPSAMGAEEPREFAFFTPSNPPAFRKQVRANSRGQVDLVADLLASKGLACDIQWSASVFYFPADQHLYILIECNVVGSRALTGTTFPVLRAKPTDDAGQVLTPDQWSWEFVGSIGTATEGFTQLAPKFRVDPSGTPTNMLIQPSLALGADGGVLLVSTPNLVDANGGHRLGCDVTELTLSPLAVVVDSNGNPRHRALVGTPDLAPGDVFNRQAGSCDYDPGLGLFIARKVPRSTSKTLTSIHRTSLTGL